MRKSKSSLQVQVWTNTK